MQSAPAAHTVRAARATGSSSGPRIRDWRVPTSLEYIDSRLIDYYRAAVSCMREASERVWVPESRRALFASFAELKIEHNTVPFRNLPDPTKGRWGEGLTAEDMRKEVPLARAAFGGASRIPGMDSASAATPALRRSANRQGPDRSHSRVRAAHGVEG